MSLHNKMGIRVDSIEVLRPWIKNTFQKFILEIHEIYHDFYKENLRDKLQTHNSKYMTLYGTQQQKAKLRSQLICCMNTHNKTLIARLFYFDIGSGIKKAVFSCCRN